MIYDKIKVCDGNALYHTGILTGFFRICTGVSGDGCRTYDAPGKRICSDPGGEH